MEVCVDHIQSALNAQQGGASRLELCSSLMDGGLTPSAGLQYIARNNLTIPLYAMIRPRGGDFTYEPYELDVMKKDIIIAKDNNMDGVVFGILTSDGKVDSKACHKLLKATSHLPATFHRAFDLVSDPFEALEEIIKLGFERIATSGRAKTALEGSELIKKLNEVAANRIQIMPACGISEENIEEILTKSGCKSFHASASSWQSTSMKFQNSEAKMGSADSDFKWKTCSEIRVSEMLKIAKNVWET